MSELIRRLTFARGAAHDADSIIRREWLVTNGLGGFASGSVAGVPTRRYHGLLISALPTPLGRTVMLNHLAEWLRLPDGRRFHVGGQERAGGTLELPGARHLTEFRLEEGLPVWRYDLEGAAVEKRVLMPHKQNTVHVNYRLLSGDGPVRLRLMPSVHFRSHDAPVNEPLPSSYPLWI